MGLTDLAKTIHCTFTASLVFQHDSLNKTEILLYLPDAAERCLSSQLATYHLEIKAS